MFCGIDSITWNILGYFPRSVRCGNYMGIYLGVLPISYNFVMDLNNVMYPSSTKTWLHTLKLPQNTKNIETSSSRTYMVFISRAHITRPRCCNLKWLVTHTHIQWIKHKPIGTTFLIQMNRRQESPLAQSRGTPLPPTDGKGYGREEIESLNAKLKKASTFL